MTWHLSARRLKLYLTTKTEILKDDEETTRLVFLVYGTAVNNLLHVESLEKLKSIREARSHHYLFLCFDELSIFMLRYMSGIVFSLFNVVS